MRRGGAVARRCGGAYGSGFSNYQLTSSRYNGWPQLVQLLHSNIQPLNSNV